MNIKAQGLLNAVKWVEETHGREVLGEIIRSCSPQVRASYVSASALEWHPAEELEEFLSVTERRLKSSAGHIAEEIGAAGARANLKGPLARFAFYVTRPELLLKRITGLWHQFNDDGEMRLLATTPNSCTIEVVGIKKPLPLFCATLTGWHREVGRSIGLVEATARHTSCRTRGQSRCIWETRWSATALEIPSIDEDRGDASEREVLAFPSTLSPVRRARSTIIIDSMNVIRASPHKDAYLALLPPAHRDELLAAVAGSWMPVTTALAHYHACDALHLPVDEQFRNGLRTFKGGGATVFGTIAKLARGLGASPWTVLPHFQRFWERVYDGGGVSVVQLGPKEARIELVQFGLLESPYYRHALRGLVTGILESVCTKAYVVERPSPHGKRDSLTLRAQWV